MSNYAASGTINAANAALATGTPTPGSFVQVALRNQGASVVVDVQGSWSGTLIAQVSSDDVNWTTVSSDLIISMASGTSGAIASAATGSYLVEGAGQFFRITAPSWISGDAVVGVSS